MMSIRKLDDWIIGRRLLPVGLIIVVVFSACPLCAQTNAPRDKIMLDVTLAARRCYVGEAVPLTLVWSVYPPPGSFKAVDIRLPVFGNSAFKVYDSHKAADKPDNSSLGLPVSGTRAIARLSVATTGGYNYTTLAVKKVIVPRVPGSHVLGSASVSCVMQRRYTEPTIGAGKGAGSLYQYPIYFNNSFFDKEVDARDTRMNAVSSSNVLEVEALPAGAPELFGGLVGSYQFSVTASFGPVRVGDPVVLTMSVSSKGHLAHVELPPLELQPGFTNRFRVASDRRLRNIDGESITFTQTVYPCAAGSEDFPALSLAYFNPASRKYETSRSRPIPMLVGKSRIIDGAALGIGEEEPDPEPGVLPWLMAVAGIAVIAIMYLRVRRSDKPEKVETVDFIHAFQQFNRSIALLKEAEFDNPRDQHHGLNSTLGAYMAAHLAGHRPGAITFSDIDQMLAVRNAGDELREKARLLFHEIDMCRFSPADPTADFAATLQQALDLVDALNRLAS